MMTDHLQNTSITLGDNRDAYESSVYEKPTSLKKVYYKVKQPCSKYDFHGWVAIIWLADWAWKDTWWAQRAYQ